MSRTRISAITGIVLLIALLAGTAVYLHGKRFTVRITEAQIGEQLASRFPIERTVLLLLRWRLTDPQVRFLPERQRIVVGLDAQLNARLEGRRKDLGGRIEMETALRYDAERGAFFLVDPVITQLAIQGLPEAHVMRVQESVHDLLVEAFRQLPVYTLQRADLAQGAARRVLKDVQIQDDAIVMVLGL